MDTERFEFAPVLRCSVEISQPYSHESVTTKQAKPLPDILTFAYHQTSNWDKSITTFQQWYTLARALQQSAVEYCRLWLTHFTPGACSSPPPKKVAAVIIHTTCKLDSTHMLVKCVSSCTQHSCTNTYQTPNCCLYSKDAYWELCNSPDLFIFQYQRLYAAVFQPVDAVSWQPAEFWRHTQSQLGWKLNLLLLCISQFQNWNTTILSINSLILLLSWYNTHTCF